jgi:hypothetical protein
LSALNRATTFRFTGVYRFQSQTVVSVVLFDRKNPHLRIGADVPWQDSYCRLTAEQGTSCEITDAVTDSRLWTHAARESVRSYVGVLLKKRDGTPLGTLCHFDLVPHRIDPVAAESLQAVRRDVEAYLWKHQPLPVPGHRATAVLPLRRRR